MAIHKLPRTRRATGWTAYESFAKDEVIIRSDGEIVPTGYPNERPATANEIDVELVKRSIKTERQRQIEAFRARPEWQDADSIRSTIELMEYDNHPLDRLTPEEWRALRIKICG